MPGRTKLRQGQTQTSKEEGGSTSRTTAQIEKYYSGGKRPFTYKKNDRGKVIKVELKGGGMSSGQAKIAAKAPPPNKIDAKDFAVLRKEKAKGRGMGLQDEKVKPGKVMKAKRGKLFQGYLGTFDASAEASTPKAQRGVTTIVGVRPGAKIGKGKKKFKSMEAMRTAKGFKTIDGKQETSSEFNKRRMKLAGATQALKASRIGKIALGIGTAGVAASQYLKSKINKKNNKTLRDARLQKKPGIPSETTQKINKALSNIKTVKLKKDKKMGGGMMMQKPMGYSEGTPTGVPRTPSRNNPARGRAGGRKARKVQSGQGPLGGAGRAAGLGALGAAARARGKEDSSVTLAKFLKASVAGTNESIKGGGMRADRATEGSGYRNKRGFRKDVEAGKYKANKDAAYYKSIGLTGKRGDRAVDDFYKPYHMRSDAIKLKSGGMTKPMGYKHGTSVTASCKLGRNKPTKIT